MRRAGLPLAGLRVAVTRPVESAAALADPLRAAGAVPVIVPLTRIAPPADERPLLQAAERLDQYDWIVFTSVNAVNSLVRCAERPLRCTARIAAVGSATAAAVRDAAGRDADLVPPEFSGEALIPAMLRQAPLTGARVLWPRAEHARAAVPRDLRNAGAVLDDPIAYRTLPDRGAALELKAMAARGDLDAITFTAPSAVECYSRVQPDPALCIIAVIGPSTAAAARAAGLTVQVEPSQYMIPALVDSLAGYIQGSGR